MTPSRISDHHECDEYFRLLTESITDIVAIIAGDDSVLTYISPAVGPCLGYTPGELIGQHAMELVHPEDRERVQARLASFTEGPVIPYTYRFRHKDGSWRFVESVARDLRQHPLIGGIVINTRDVTARVRLEREVAQLNRLTGLGRLATQVAHEFNNVLMGIQPFITIIRKRTAGDPDMTRMTGLVNAAIERGRRITHDILHFSRPAEPAFAVVDVHDLLHAAAEEIRHRLPAIRMNVVTPAKPVSILADRGQIMQVLINLAANANDAMRERGGTLTLAASGCDRYTDFRTLRDPQSFVHFTVADTGEGIAPENLDHVFEPMFTTKHTGTGLGLSVVHQVVTLHNGHVFVESIQGEGTSMHVFLPRASTEAVEVHADAPRHDTASHRVLVIEGDTGVAEGIVAALGSEGLVAHAARTGHEGLAAVDEFEPDVVILGLRLPGADERDVYDRLAEKRPDLPVIFSGGHAMERELERHLSRPNVRFLLKPYSIDKLMGTIVEVMLV
jgi:PAS domain S-box-containing protein